MVRRARLEKKPRDAMDSGSARVRAIGDARAIDRTWASNLERVIRWGDADGDGGARPTTRRCGDGDDGGDARKKIVSMFVVERRSVRRRVVVARGRW